MNRFVFVVLSLVLSARFAAADEFPSPPNTEQGNPSPIARKEDADDHNLPLLVWYGLSSLDNELVAQLVELAR